MAGTSSILPLLLVCCTLVIQVICSKDNIKVVDVPPEIDQTKNFLKSIRQQINDLPETDVYYEDDDDNLQEPTEESFADASTESITLETDSNSVALEDILQANKPELTQDFLNMERKHVRYIMENIADDSLPSNSDLNEDALVTDKNSAVTSDESMLNGIEDVLVTEIPLDSKMIQNFIDSERYHTYLTENELQDSKASNLKTTVQEGTSNIDVCGTVNLDKIVDQLLDGLRHDIVERGLDKIKIPDVYETFVEKAGFIQVKGYFQAQEGWAKNLSTIHRTAHVIATSHGNSISVSCGFGLSNLEFGYDKYKAKFMKIGPSGKLDVSISKNSILLNATISWNNGTCTTTLDYLSLNQLGGFNMKITGLGPLNWLLSKVSGWLFRKFHEDIRVKLETVLKEEIEKQLETLDCTRYLLGWQ